MESLICNSQQCTFYSLLVCSYDIMESCWKQDPENRPAFSEIHQTLCALIEAKNSDNYISMMEMDLWPTEHVQVDDECSDELQMAENPASLMKNEMFTDCVQDSRVVVEVY